DGTVQAYQPNGASSSVTASWLEDATVRALRISRDATRALVVRENDGVVQAEVAAVMRDPDGRPVSLGDPVVICEMLVTAGDATWVDEQTVAVLGTSGADTTTAVHLVTIGGPTTVLPAIEGATRVVAGTGDRSLIVGTEDGSLYERNGLGWTLTGSDVYDPTLPG
ncbi:MAG TPA: LpqB family beta-propeller domain-containing protein, partial [Actinomycetaceae bacterium]|nr:LpqB family beta-propeller domain-containing protein [Actinomycetaceae bacterium]